jgi:malate dehydrogenase
MNPEEENEMKIAIIGGGGTLGSCTAYTLALKGLADEIVLLDVNRNLALAHFMDITTAIVGIQNTEIRVGHDEDLNHSDIVIVVAGVPHPSVPSHLEMLRANLSLLRDTVQKIGTSCPEAIVITATNPVDSVNLGMFLMSTKLSRTRLLGYDLNDSLRFQQAVAIELGKKSTEVEALALGEHVETLALIFSSVRVSKQPITLSGEAKERIKTGVPKMLKSYTGLGINRTAGWTSASGISQMVESIVKDSRKVFPCSAVLEGEYGYKGISMGVPVVLGKEGISKIMELDLSQEEQKDLGHSATALETKAHLVREFANATR